MRAGAVVSSSVTPRRPVGAVSDSPQWCSAPVRKKLWQCFSLASDPLQLMQCTLLITSHGVISLCTVWVFDVTRRLISGHHAYVCVWRQVSTVVFAALPTPLLLELPPQSVSVIPRSNSSITRPPATAALVLFACSRTALVLYPLLSWSPNVTLPVLAYCTALSALVRCAALPLLRSKRCFVVVPFSIYMEM